MQYILSRRSQPLFDTLSRDQTLCAFDFDGTLAPIVERPDLAQMPSTTAKLLCKLAVLYPCIVVSGRAWSDIAAKVDSIPLRQIYGSHGAETKESANRLPPEVQHWKALLERDLTAKAGVWIEDKGTSLAIHYRQAPRPAEAEQQILSAATNIPGARVIGGKRVVNLVVDRHPNKGTVVAAERERLHCNWILYVGDDDNDEDAFAIPGQVIGVRVGRKKNTHAKYFLRKQDEISALITRLVDGRAHRNFTASVAESQLTP